MKRAVIGVLAVASVSLGACDRFKGDEPAPAATKAAAKPAPKKPAVNQPVEDAMMSIPPELREAYQQAFVCEVRGRKAENKAIEVTPAYVKDLTRRLQENPRIAKC